mmetsp:Transcript_21679/g.63726  ORF Transcript_21679/g.63726 Transcript_21679/m.63726 type:complete len:230 (+) Transcript_21679:1285-1974(+)
MGLELVDALADLGNQQVGNGDEDRRVRFSRTSADQTMDEIAAPAYEREHGEGRTEKVHGPNSAGYLKIVPTDVVGFRSLLDGEDPSAAKEQIPGRIVGRIVRLDQSYGVRLQRPFLPQYCGGKDVTATATAGAIPGAPGALVDGDGLPPLEKQLGRVQFVPPHVQGTGGQGVESVPLSPLRLECDEDGHGTMLPLRQLPYALFQLLNLGVLIVGAGKERHPPRAFLPHY